MGKAMTQDLRYGRPEIFNTDRGSQFTPRRTGGSADRVLRNWADDGSCGWGPVGLN